MSKKTSYLFGILLTIVVGTFFYWKFCCCSCCTTNTKAGDLSGSAVTNVVAGNHFKIDNQDFKYETTKNFKFLKNDFANVLPISDSVNFGIDALKLHFDKNPSQKLLITGYATSDEKNTSAYPNLGFARANAIKNYFISKGFLASQFDTNGVVKDTWQYLKDTILGPNNFEILSATPKTASKDWNVEKAKINANPLVLYFNTNQTEINLTADERQKVADLVEYLDNVPSAKLNAIGHTDNAGKRELNISLGLNRANFAKDYLVKNSVAAEKIETLSQGPDQPIADNTSADGKSKNRRTVITIK